MCKSNSAPINSGGVIWITGLSGAGKSTLASNLAASFQASRKDVIALDGDSLRELFNATGDNAQNNCRERRLSISRQYSNLCKIIADQGFIVIIATISLFKEVHDWNRANLPGYFEVYIKVPLEELRRRDPKGIYRRFELGELSNVAGLDLIVDEPKAPDLIIEFKNGSDTRQITDNLIKQFLGKINED